MLNHKEYLDCFENVENQNNPIWQIPKKKNKLMGEMNQLMNFTQLINTENLWNNFVTYQKLIKKKLGSQHDLVNPFICNARHTHSTMMAKISLRNYLTKNILKIH